MKKLLFIIAAFVFSAQLTWAQKVWTYPVLYMPDEQVTWYMDLSDYMLSEGEPLYIWTWAPTNPENVHHPGDATDFWNNPTDELSKLTYEGRGVYSITMTPTEWYGKTLEEMYENEDIFWFNVRRPGGAEYTEIGAGTLRATRPFFDELRSFPEEGVDVKLYPSKFTYKTPMSILVNLDYLRSGDEVGGLVGYDFVSLHLHSGCNEFADHLMEFQVWVPERVAATRFKKISDKIYKFDMPSPAEYYGITDEEIDNGYALKNIQFVLPTFVNGDWGKLGVNAAGSDFRFYAADVEPDPDPTFYYFPAKFSSEDFLTLVREYDDNAANLEYTITAGSKTLTGEFSGVRSKRSVTINLFDGLKGEKGLTKLHLKVTRKDSGTTVKEMDIPLVEVDVE